MPRYYVDLTKLNQLIESSGLKPGFIVQRLNLPSYEALKRRLRGETEFKLEEAGALAKLLNLSAEEANSIFFATKVDKLSS